MEASLVDLQFHLHEAQVLLEHPHQEAYARCVHHLREAYRMTQMLTENTPHPWPVLIVPHALHLPNVHQNQVHIQRCVEDALWTLRVLHDHPSRDHLVQDLARFILDALKLL